MYKICFTVPESHCEKVKQALFQAGAGKQGEYTNCAWQTKGTGQFKPSLNSNPFIGQHNQIESLEEIKVEMICEDQNIKHAIRALITSHPYEEPAVDVWKLENIF